MTAAVRPLGPAPTTTASTVATPSSLPRSPVLGVGVVEAAAGVPLRALVAVGGDAAGVLEHPGQMEEVPGHERGVAVGEVVLRPTRSGVEVRRPRSRLADPAGVGLGRDDVAEVLERVQDVHGAVLDPVLVAGDEAAPT